MDDKDKSIQQGHDLCSSSLSSSLPSSSSTTILLSPPNPRAAILNKQLHIIRQQEVPRGPYDDGNNNNNNNNCNVNGETSAGTEIMIAAFQSLKDPTQGYDQRFGKSALKTYLSFVYPKKNPPVHHLDDVQLEAAAGRCAQQIDFLIKRHRSHETEWIRHHDGTTTTTTTSATSENNTHQTKVLRRFPIVLVLDNLRSALNVGSLYRTAETCACEEVITCGITPHPNGNGAEKLRKSALGAEHLVPTQHFPTTQQALQHIRSHNPQMYIVAMETTARSRMYTSIDYAKCYDNGGGIALVLGNEVTGVDAELLTTEMDDIVELPTFGEKNSLNVAACAPVVIYEILRQWKVSK